MRCLYKHVKQLIVFPHIGIRTEVDFCIDGKILALLWWVWGNNDFPYFANVATSSYRRSKGTAKLITGLNLFTGGMSIKFIHTSIGSNLYKERR